MVSLRSNRIIVFMNLNEDSKLILHSKRTADTINTSTLVITHFVFGNDIKVICQSKWKHAVNNRAWVYSLLNTVTVKKTMLQPLWQWQQQQHKHTDRVWMCLCIICLCCCFFFTVTVFNTVHLSLGIGISLDLIEWLLNTYRKQQKKVSIKSASCTVNRRLAAQATNRLWD